MSYTIETDISCPNCSSFLFKHEKKPPKHKCKECDKVYEVWGDKIYESVLHKIIS